MSKKKILVIPSWYPSKDTPGLGTFFREQAALLTEDFDIRLMAGYLDRNISRWQKLQNTLQFALTKHVNVKEKNDYFLSPPHVYGFAYAKGVNRFEKLNYEMLYKSWVKFFDKDIFQKWKPDLIHAHDTFFGGIIANIIHERWSIPYIITEHNNFLHPHPDFVKVRFLKALRKANTVLLVSEYQKRILLSVEPEIKISVVGNFISEQKFNLKLKDKTKPFRILYVGRYVNIKDYNTLLSTIIKFSELMSRSEYLFELIGFDNKGKQEIINKLEKHNLQNRCKIHTYVSRDDILSFYHNCDIVLNTSISETFGLVTGEAMMCGKPVVSTNNGGFDEMFVPGVNGIKCAIGDAEGLANALLKIHNGEVRFDPVRIRESVLHKFGTEAFKAKMKKFYE